MFAYNCTCLFNHNLILNEWIHFFQFCGFSKSSLTGIRWCDICTNLVIIYLCFITSYSMYCKTSIYSFSSIFLIVVVVFPVFSWNVTTFWFISHYINEKFLIRECKVLREENTVEMFLICITYITNQSFLGCSYLLHLETTFNTKTFI